MELLNRAKTLDLVKELTNAKKRPAPSTFSRWRLRGVGGVKLRTLLINGQYFTTRDWLLEFFEYSAAAKAGSARPDLTRSQQAVDREAEELLA